ncbi:MAG: sodium/proton-translocating pyrophosphatase [Eubacteriales bacterium]
MEFLVIIVSVLALLFALIQGISITRVKVTDEKIIKIGGYIRSGAMAYLKRQYKILSVYVAVVAIILFILPGMGILTTAAFLLGTIFSVTAGFFGMKAATSANMRTTQAAKSGLQEAFKFAFSGGSVMGLSVVGLGALGISVLYLIFKDVTILTGFSFGASSIALFCRVGGGIYTKAADVGADLVGKVEAGIPEDDARNPAVIADNVGDNVGDVAGMGSDLFESYVGCIVSALLLAFVWGGETGIPFVY